MVPNADDVHLDYQRRSDAAAQEWATTRKLKSDPRITPVGAALRKLSIDELPQLINVLRGEMSIVGPRPIVFDEIPMYGVDIGFYFCTRPGITGAWQVNGRSNESYARRVNLDRRYVENWSVWADFWIVVKTIPAVLAARDAY
jgi:lipopolysaccharide/colanic/teichoic acid biosynthesis glycosyltransferase